jgi:hypothetical protein
MVGGRGVVESGEIPGLDLPALLRRQDAEAQRLAG